MKQNKNIIIKNIYYMLSYAFKTLKHEAYKDVEVESFEEMYDLLAAILDNGVGYQIKKGLYKEYTGRCEPLSTIRGRINMPETIKNKMACKRLITCDFDELSVDNKLNQILKTTIFMLLKHSKVKQKYKDSLKGKLLFFTNVSMIEAKSIRWDTIRFQRNNLTYRMLMGICQLIIEGLLSSTESGTHRLATFDDEQKMCMLYQNFILEYYRRHYKNRLSVSAPQVPWALDNDYKFMLPVMQTDIHLQKGNTVLIIDAKYYGHSTQSNFNKKTIHSGNLYQIFTYVKNRDFAFKEQEHTVSGMLLYAKTLEQIQPDSIYQMHGNQISVQTLDLNNEFNEIAKQLDDIVEEHFGKIDKIA